MTKIVTAKVHVQAKTLEATFDKKLLAVQFSRRVGAPGMFDVSISPQASLPVGPFKTDLQLDVISPSGERLAGAILPVSANIQPEVRPLPARLLLGSRPIGETAVAEVVLQAPENAKVVVEQIETDSPDLHVEPATITGCPADRTFRITQKIGVEGDHSSAVRFTIRMGNQPRVKVAMEVFYRGQIAEKNRTINQGVGAP